jgi:pilus assembly protein Flp/PilA
MLQIITSLQTWLSTRSSDERGATAVEYGLLVALIAAIIVTVVALLGTQVQGAFQTVSDNMP